MIKVKESAAPRKPKAAVRKPVARRVTKAAKPKRKVRHDPAVFVDGFWRSPVNPLVIPIEPCPNCNGTGRRPRAMTPAERQRKRRLKGGK